MQGWKLILRGFEGRVKLVFPFLDPHLGYWYIIWKVNTKNRGLSLKAPFVHFASGVEDFMQSASSFFKKS